MKLMAVEAVARAVMFLAKHSLDGGPCIPPDGQGNKNYVDDDQRYRIRCGTLRIRINHIGFD